MFFFSLLFVFRKLMLGPVLFSSQGKLLAEVRFLMRQDQCKNPLKYKEILPQESVPNKGQKWLATVPQHSTLRIKQPRTSQHWKSKALQCGTTSASKNGLNSWQRPVLYQASRSKLTNGKSAKATRKKTYLHRRHRASLNLAKTYHTQAPGMTTPKWLQYQWHSKHKIHQVQ
jgi:hypothetical protein